MASPIWILGSPLFAKDARGRLASRIATAFPRERALVTLPGIHATQRQAFVEALEKRREADGQVLLTRAERRAVWDSAVDLIVEEDVVLVAGKGHESYQEIAGQRLPFSDADRACDAIARRGGRQS